MTIQPVPERGQPIDTSYIYQIVETLNRLSEKLSTSSNNLWTVRDNSALMSKSKIIAKTVSVGSGLEVKAGDTRSFSLSFNGDFDSDPIVTATIQNETETLAGKNAFVILNNVSQSGVSGFVRFNENGTANVLVHIIAIGIKE